MRLGWGGCAETGWSAVRWSTWLKGWLGVRANEWMRRVSCSHEVAPTSFPPQSEAASQPATTPHTPATYSRRVSKKDGHHSVDLRLGRVIVRCCSAGSLAGLCIGSAISASGSSVLSHARAPTHLSAKQIQMRAHTNCFRHARYGSRLCARARACRTDEAAWPHACFAHARVCRCAFTRMRHWRWLEDFVASSFFTIASWAGNAASRAAGTQAGSERGGASEIP